MTARPVIVTRPAREAAQWVSDLRAAGLDAVALPLIVIEPVADAE
ncbi:uroporphyrinogen-III synthase, partial [Variovorax sp. RHLX14]